MGLKIYNNMAAQQANYYLSLQQTSFGKSVERLSSGLRINRAADDPAGLLISEKYRAQIEGLGQAISNATDGIGMVQTAEGALDEVSKVLRTMRNLALHAANTATSDTESIAADQAQIESEIETLNRIANTTQFGSKKLLDGSSGITGTTTDSDVTFISGSTSTDAGTYAVSISTAAVKGQLTNSAKRYTTAVTGTGGSGAALAAGAATLTFSGSLVGGSPVVFNFAGGETLDATVTALSGTTELTDLGFAFERSGNNLKITNSRLSVDDDFAVLASTADIKTKFGIDNTGGGGNDNSADQVDATSSATLRSSETLTFRNGAGTYVSVALTAGQAISSAVTQVQNALDAAGIKVDFEFDAGTVMFTVTNQDYGSDSNVLNSFESSLAASTTNTGIATAGSTQVVIANGTGAAAHTAGEDVAGTIGGYAATGEGVMLSGNSSTPVDGLQLRIAGGVAGAQGTVTIEKNPLSFQIGPFASQQVEMIIDDMRANRLGISATGITYMTSISVADIDVTAGGGDGSQDAIRVLDDAISQVSTLRATLGSFQKDVLESTVNSLGVAKQNLASSESNIRDADMAVEMTAFSKAQILQQSAVAMLSQANSAPQLILQLFQNM